MLCSFVTNTDGVIVRKNSIEGTEYDDGRNEPSKLEPRLVPPAARSFFAD